MSYPGSPATVVQQRGQDVVRVLMDWSKGTVTQEATQGELSETSLHPNQFCRASLAPGPLENPQSPWFPWKLQKRFSHSDPKTETIREGCSPG